MRRQLLSTMMLTLLVLTPLIHAQNTERPPQASAQNTERRAPSPQPYVADDRYLKWNVQPADKAYTSIDGKQLKGYVQELAAISRRYRDKGHPQFWGRIIGTEADAENAKWLVERFKKIGLTDVREQSFDLPPQWMPQSWSVSATDPAGKSLKLDSAQPTHRSEATPADGLDLEAVEVGLGGEGDLVGRDLKGKAVFFYSTDLMSRHSTISGGAIKRINDAGAAAIFIILAVPGNIRTQFYPVGSTVPSFSLGHQDGRAMLELIGKARGGPPARVKIRLDVKQVPNLKTSTVHGMLPGMTDETIYIVGHRDGWFDAANDNGTGVASMVGIAEYFAKVPKEKRRRTIMFLGTSGHHDGAAMSGRWLVDHKEVFAKTALLINCEHTAAAALVLYNGNIRKANVAQPVIWHVGGSEKLLEIANRSFDAFGVVRYSVNERSASGEIGRFQQFAPALQVIDTGLYWHSDHETAELIPPTGLEAVTRAYAKIIDGVNTLELKDLQRPAAAGTPR